MIYADRLTLTTCLSAVKHSFRSGSLRTPKTLRLLDAPKDTLLTGVLRLALRAFRFDVAEVPFFTGHLYSPGGQAVWLAARAAADETCFRLARRTLRECPQIAALNDRWGRNTVLLHIAKHFWTAVFQPVVRMKAAEALSAQEPGEHVALIRLPRILETEDLPSAQPNVCFSFYRTRLTPLDDTRLFVLFWWLAYQAVSLRSRLRLLMDGPPPASSLLLLQEDELSSDRSYRGQPHWLYPEDAAPEFSSAVLISPNFAAAIRPDPSLDGLKVVAVSRRAIAGCGHPRMVRSLQRTLARETRRLLVRSLTLPRSMSAAAGSAAQLFFYAEKLAAFSAATKVKAFMTCENYLPEADAMRLIADSMGIHTFSYQYSNRADRGPLMMTTAHTMFLFSPLYASRWNVEGVGPGKAVSTGYLYDRSFDLVRRRAARHREQLKASGAQFVICYFDESVQSDKYGLIHQKDHVQDLLALIDAVLRDPSIGVVVKSQFQRNAPKAFDALRAPLQAARETGRYLELSHGHVRNNVFPAEAAACADVAIGHAVGGTASLEAVLAGTRCILLNPYRYRSDNDSLYAKADIVYESMQSAMIAVREHRTGDPRRRLLGDWSGIIDEFDAFRDGKAAMRLRASIQSFLEGKGI